LVGFATSNSTSGAGADIVMESITLKTRFAAQSVKWPAYINYPDCINYPQR